MRLVPDFEVVDEAAGVLYLTAFGDDGSWSREVPLRFVRTGSDPVVLAPGEAEPRWALSLSLHGRARWRVGDRTSGGSAEPIEDPAELTRLLERFGSRFGEANARRWFPDTVHGYRLRERAIDTGSHQSEVETYFDRLAPRYDTTLEGNPIDRNMRLVSLRVLSEVFHPRDYILEIGCGTGWETLPLARRGIRLLATDLSREMLRQLERKAAHEGLSRAVETRRLAARDVGSLLAEYAPGSFDGAFSDFGALNCEPDMTGVPSALGSLLKPGGILVLAIWNRFCAAETLLSIAARRPDRALARLETPVPVGHSRFGVPVHARGVGEFLDTFRPFFRVERILGLPVFVPPYDFASKIAGTSGLLSILEGLDAAFASRFPFNRLGDHFLAVMRRRP